jgi:hypothetical protein
MGLEIAIEASLAPEDVLPHKDLGHGKTIDKTR